MGMTAIEGVAIRIQTGVEGMAQQGTYQIVCKTTGQRYIGATWGKAGFKQRWGGHLSLLRRGLHNNPSLQAAWALYGESDFHWGILDVLPADKGLCLQREKTYFDTCDRDTLFNVQFGDPPPPPPARGPRQPQRHTQATKDKMSATRRGVPQSAALIAARTEGQRRARALRALAASAHQQLTQDVSSELPSAPSVLKDVTILVSP